MQHGCFRTASDVEPAILTLVLLAGGAPERYDPGFRSRNLAQQHGVRSGVVKTSSMQLQSPLGNPLLLWQGWFAKHR